MDQEDKRSRYKIIKDAHLSATRHKEKFLFVTKVVDGLIRYLDWPTNNPEAFEYGRLDPGKFDYFGDRFYVDQDGDAYCLLVLKLGVPPVGMVIPLQVIVGKRSGGWYIRNSLVPDQGVTVQTPDDHDVEVFYEQTYTLITNEVIREMRMPRKQP